MTKKYHDTEYLYLSACIHSWETRLLTPERREQLLSAPTDRDAARVLEEMGWPAFDPESEAALDQAVGRRREELFARLGKDMPDARILDVFRLPTDYHNLKVLVKSRGEDCRRLLMARRPMGPGAAAVGLPAAGAAGLPPCRDGTGRTAGPSGSGGDRQRSGVRSCAGRRLLPGADPAGGCGGLPCPDGLSPHPHRRREPVQRRAGPTG